MAEYSDITMTQLDDIESLVVQHAARLSIDPCVALDNALRFAKIVGALENDGKLQGSNKTSSAKGLYQFVDGSVVPALNRVERYVECDWIEECKEHKDANRMTWNQQTLMFLGDMLEKRGSDKYMRDVLVSLETEAVRDAYYVLHHTNPDGATKRRTERLLSATLYTY